LLRHAGQAGVDRARFARQGISDANGFSRIASTSFLSTSRGTYGSDPRCSSSPYRDGEAPSLYGLSVDGRGSSPSGPWHRASTSRTCCAHLAHSRTSPERHLNSRRHG
jgi:hypothetical protein